MFSGLLKRLRGKQVDAVPSQATEVLAFDGTHSRKWWATRDEGPASSAEGYWAHRTHASRDVIAQIVAALPGQSVLEVGVHAGPTLWAIAQRKRFERMAGTELSPTILEFTREHLPQAVAMPVELVEAAADALPFEDKSFDVVVTCMVMLCVGPEAIEASLSELVRVCRGHIVLGEPFSDDPAEASPQGRLDPYPNTSYWIRNYPEMLKGRAELVQVKKLAPEQLMGHLDSVTVLKVV